jgi:cysteine synthase A
MNSTLTLPTTKDSTYESILNTIGHTPLIKLKKLSAELGFQVYGKLEMANPGGSIKDRTSLSIIEEGITNGTINKNTTLIESSSGNMAIGLAQVCSYHDIPLVIVVDPKANKHTLKILNAYGVKVDMVEKASENGGYLGARLQRVKELVSQIPNATWTNQYGNKANPKAHHQTMSEIYADLPNVDYVFSATSTCGTLMGCADFIKDEHLDTKLIAVDAKGSVIFGDTPNDRQIPGHGAGLPSQFLDKGAIHDVVHITDKECVTGCHKLLKLESILAGGSSGAVTMAIEKLKNKIAQHSTCVLILCDRGERYIDTIYNKDWVAQKLG